MHKPSGDPSILKFLGSFQWEGIERTSYKQVGDHWLGVSRTELIAEPSRNELPFHVRYFEVEPGGYSSLEKHAHEHVVIVVRGAGTVLLEDRDQPIASGDIVHVRSWQRHQFRAGAAEPLGFYCIVPAERDRPVIEGGGESACELPNPAARLDAPASGQIT